MKGFKFIESEPTEFKAATASDPKSLETNPNNNETNQDLVVQTTTTNNNTDVKGSSSTDPNPIKIIAPGHSGLISITDCQMTETQLHDILQLYQNDPLPFELALHNVTLIDDQAPINTELKLPLIKLYCENCEFNDQALSFVFKLLQFSSCSSKTLHIANTNLSNEQIGLLLRTVNKTNQLRYLILDTMTNLTSAELSKIIKHGLQVEFLKLTGFDFTADKAIDLLPQSSHGQNQSKLISATMKSLQASSTKFPL
ncbi:MAG: hypothetical protein HWD59_10200 [Coxiellaceae bacterium]|nr:MAG: hypothetical protein HWD59_10200 [Coxiellaceae bacterium]